MKRSRNRSGQVVMLVFLFMMIILGINVCYLCTTGKTMISNVNIRDFAKKRGGGQVTKVIQAARGTIYTSDNEIVASDVKKYKLRAVLSERYSKEKVPAYVLDKDKTAEQLAPILGVSKDTIMKSLNKKADSVELGECGSKLSAGKKAKIEALGLPGFRFTKNRFADTYALEVVLKECYTSKEVPAYVVDKNKTAELLAPILGVSKQTVLSRLTQKTYQVEFGNYGRNLSSITKEKIQSLELPGLEFDEITSRNYHFGDFASYEVGYAAVAAETDPYNIIGQIGIEKSYNNWLKGTNGERIYLVDSKRNTLPNGVISDKKAVSGNDVYLTINSTLQTELDSLMKDMQENTKATKACAAVMNAKTGALLAISNYPSFDPNKRNFTNYNDTFLNEAFECGSVFKPFVYANALTDGVLDLDSKYNSGTYDYKSNGRVIATIHDHNRTGWGRITYRDGLYHSSNTAICHILAEHTNMSSLIEDYKNLGLFQTSKVDGLFSGSGVKGFDGKTKSLEYFTTGFGQGSSITTLQLLRGYSAFANDGRTVEPYLVEKVVNPTNGKTLYTAKTSYSKKIYSTEAVAQMRTLLYGVVNIDGSTGRDYKDSSVEIIGKTGTGQIAENGAYSSTKHTHSFVGMAPYRDPEVEVIVWFQNEKSGTNYSGALVKSIIKSALNILSKDTEKVNTTPYVLNNYMNQSTQYVEGILKKHSLTPVVIGDGSTVIGQYPSGTTEVTTGSKVLVLTDGQKYTMPSMLGWSRKEAEAFASLTGVEIKMNGLGSIYAQSITKGTELKQGTVIELYAK